MRDIGKEAEEVIKSLVVIKTRFDKDLHKKVEYSTLKLTTGQIRKFLTAVNAITNKVNIYKARHLGATKLPDELAGEVQFLKVKAAYQAGRDNSKDKVVHKFLEASNINQEIESIGTSIAKYEEFARYIEALVAYHKFYGGKD